MKSDDSPAKTDESTAGAPMRVQHTWSVLNRPSTAVIEVIAATTDRDPTIMSPLYEHVDPDALNAVLASRTNGRANEVTVSFTYDDVTVRVDSSGWVEVQSDSVGRE